MSREASKPQASCGGPWIASSQGLLAMTGLAQYIPPLASKLPASCFGPWMASATLHSRQQ